MADVTQNVIIEFISDTTKLEPAVDQLEKIGKVEQGQAAAFKATNTEINKQAEALKKVSAVNQQIDATGKITKKNVADLATAVKGMSGTFQKEFKAGVIDGLKQAGVSIKDFEKQLDSSFDKSETATLSLKSQLRGMVEQLAQLKVQGKDNSAEFQKLAQDAGRLKDAIGDANLTVKNFGSDTAGIDGAISLVSGLAGGFAVVQGAAALFGDESEALQKTLLRVNAAMAILQGLQQIQITLQKESAASQFANTIATKAQAAAQVVYNFVVGSSVGVLKAFRIALAATGIGLFIIGIVKLVEILSEANTELEDTNSLLESQKTLIDSLNESVEKRASLEEATARTAGKAESDLIRIRGRALQAQRAFLVESNALLADQQKKVSSTSEAWFNLNKQIEENTNTISGIDNQILIKQQELIKQEADEREEAAKKRKDEAKQALADAKRLAEERLQKAKEARAAEFQNFKAGIELELLAAEKGSDAELAIKKRLLDAEFQIQIDNEKLTNNQRELLFQKFLKDRNDLDDQYQKDRFKKTVENIQAGIDADLAALELSFDDKLRFTETAIRLQAQAEIAAAEGNAAKIIEIEARRDKAIRDARIASIEETLAFELSLAEVGNAARLRAIQRQLDDEKTALRERIGLIDEQTGIELQANFKRLIALNKEREDKLISEKDYNLKYKKLIDEQVQIVENGEKKKTDSTTSEGDKRIQRFKQEIELIAAIASEVSDILSGIADIQAQQENNKIASDRQKIKELQDAGAISEKEAIKRMKKLDAEERVIKQKQAQRDKSLALFQAIINTARGVAAAIPDPFMIALAIAIGAAQIAIIAAKPIPKFAKGKKGNYKGLAEVGEAGSELVEKNGKMFVAEKSSIVYLGSKDKVYSHKETVEMMSKPAMSRERNGVMIPNNKGTQFDYKQMGEEVGKHVQQTIVVDGVTEQVIKKKDFIKYLDSRRSF